MVAIKKDILPKGYRTAKKNGLYAEFDENGQLRHYGWYYPSGEPGGRWMLFLDPEKMEGRAEHFRIADRFPEEGKSSDADFQQFLDGWADAINERSGDADVCNFCYQEAGQVDQLLKGAGVAICNYCVDDLVEVLAMDAGASVSAEGELPPGQEDKPDDGDTED